MSIDHQRGWVCLAKGLKNKAEWKGKKCRRAVGTGKSKGLEMDVNRPSTSGDSLCAGVFGKGLEK
jgi:hypothetical protein